MSNEERRELGKDAGSVYTVRGIINNDVGEVFTESNKNHKAMLE